MTPPPVLFKTMSFTAAPPPPRPTADQDLILLRLLATLVDLAVACALFLLAATLAGAITTNNGVQVHLHGSGPFVLWLVAVLLYSFLTETFTGQTLGKAVFGLHVVHARDGAHPSHRAIATRTLLRLIDALPAFYALGALVLLITPTRQRLGDLAARTIVIRTRP